MYLSFVQVFHEESEVVMKLWIPLNHKIMIKIDKNTESAVNH